MRHLKITAVALVLAGVAIQAYGQKYFTRNGNITFTSEAPIERIEAENKSASSVLDTESGRLEFAVLIKGFHFEKALMQEHFNENYMESNKYPKATFKGAIKDTSTVDFSKPGKYNVVVTGDITIHGVTTSLEVPGIIQVGEGGDIAAHSTFDVAVADYEIEIPSVVRDNIAKVVTIHVDIDYEPLKKRSK